MTKSITPGTYVLTKDVKNPKPDRRVRRDWTKKEVWEKGTVLIAQDRYNTSGEGIPSLSLVGDRFAILHPWDVAKYKVLIDALEPCDESLSAMFTRLDVEQSNQYFLRFLIETGRMTKEQFEETWSDYQDWMNQELDEQPDNAERSGSNTSDLHRGEQLSAEDLEALKMSNRSSKKYIIESIRRFLSAFDYEPYGCDARSARQEWEDNIEEPLAELRRIASSAETPS